ncbi:MAG: hypothetical protein ABJH52_17200 [Henriciella sp.]
MIDVIPLSDVQKIPASKQYDLFTQFYGDALELSNTIELWDSLPLYHMSTMKQKHLRDGNGRLKPMKNEVLYRPSGRNQQPKKVHVRMQAASIDAADGSVKDYYPSATEEIIMEILRKIFNDQQYGFHNEAREESWVTFTISMLRKELKARGRTRSHDEILQSLKILSRCHLEVKLDGERKAIISQPILSHALESTRSDWVADPHARWAVKLPLMLSRAVNQITYRQYNYGVQLVMKSQLARWLHKRLAHNYTNADIMTPYHITIDSIERDSCMLNHIKPDRNMKTVMSAWAELESKDVLMSVPKPVPTADGQGLKFVVYPTPRFVDEMKAANGRKTKAEAICGDLAARRRIAGKRARDDRDKADK